MKIFCYKILLFTLIILSINQILLALAPYSWGNPLVATKLAYLKKHADEYNTFFLGTSKFYRHIIPKGFDLLVNRDERIILNSFNLGSPGASNPENFYLLEKIINDKALNQDYLIVEFTPNNIIEIQNRHSARAIYNMDFIRLQYAIRIMLKSRFTENYDYLSFLTPFYKRVLLTGVLNELIDNLYSEPIVPFKGKILAHRGFLTLGNKKSRRDFLERKDTLKRTSEEIKKLYKLLAESKKLHNPVYLAYAKKMINLAKKRGIKLLFVLTPRNTDPDTVFTFYMIEPPDRIDLNDPIRFPEFYSEEYSWDMGHLNKKGASVFTKRLSQAFLKKITD